MIHPPPQTDAAGVQPAAQPQNARIAFAPARHYSTGHIDITLLLNHLDLPALVEHLGISVQRSGGGYRGCCPIHHGNNPTSFELYKVKSQKGPGDEWRWRCHTRCNTGGDAIELVRQLRGVDFLEAVEFLAGYRGISLETLGWSVEVVAERAQKRRTADLMTDTVAYYARCLQAHPPAQQYLLQRGFTPETIQQANWGYSDSRDGLFCYLTKTGYDLKLAYQLGLLRSDHCDFTANASGHTASPDGYIVMPHYNGDQAAYFSARAITPPDRMPDPGDKSRNLPGSRKLYWATVPADPNLVVVEGPMDAETLRQWGISAVALCGLGSIPDEDIAHIKSRQVVSISLDNDSLTLGLPAEERRKIGERNEQTFQRLCAQLGPLTMVATDLPNKDWNAALQAGVCAQKARSLFAQHTTPWIERRIRMLYHVAPAELSALTDEIKAMLNDLVAPVRQRYMNQAAKALGISLKQFTKLVESRPETESDRVAAIINGRLHYMGQALGNFWARIERELSISDGVNPPRVEYEIAGGLANGEKLPKILLDANQFANLEWIARHWGARVIIQVPPSQNFLIARSIQHVSLETIRREMLFTYTGWAVLNDQRGFLTANGFLSASGLDETILVDLGVNNLKHYALPAPAADLETRQLAVNTSLDFLRLGPRSITASLWAGMFAAPFTAIRPLNAVIAVYGSTQSGKSTVAHLVLTHYGVGFINGHDYRSPIDWISTKTSIEGAMFTIKDGAIIIDDYAPQFASPQEARSMHRSAEYVVRTVGNRSARSRSRADLSQQTTRVPRSLVIMTAENPLIGQSVVGRMIYVGMRRGDILPDTENGELTNPKLDDLQERAQKGLLNQAMSLFIQYLAGHWDELSARFAEMVDESSDWARAQGGLQNRLPDAFGVLNAAQTLALQVFRDIGLVDGSDVEKLTEENRSALLAVISSQAERVAAESPVLKLLSALQSQLATHKVYLAPRSEQSSYIPPPGAEMVGWYDTDAVYLDTHRALAAAKVFYKALDQNLDIMPDALQQQIAQVPGLLYERDRDGRHLRVAKWLDGAVRRVLVLSKASILERYGLDISNNPAIPGPDGE